jgi:hypothetical protein
LIETPLESAIGQPLIGRLEVVDFPAGLAVI